MSTNSESKPDPISGSAHPKFVLHEQLLPDFGIPWSKQHLLRLEKAGDFPRRLYLGNNTISWIHSEIAEWARQRVAQSRAAA